MMMVANLVGFCLGLDGMKAMLQQIFSSADGKTFKKILGKLSCVLMYFCRSHFFDYGCYLFIYCCTSHV